MAQFTLQKFQREVSGKQFCAGCCATEDIPYEVAYSDPFNFTCVVAEPYRHCTTLPAACRSSGRSRLYLLYTIFRQFVIHQCKLFRM